MPNWCTFASSRGTCPMPHLVTLWRTAGFYVLILHLSLPGSGWEWNSSSLLRPPLKVCILTFASAGALPLFSPFAETSVSSGFARGVRNRLSICSPLRSFLGVSLLSLNLKTRQCSFGRLWISFFAFSAAWFYCETQQCVHVFTNTTKCEPPKGFRLLFPLGFYYFASQNQSGYTAH